MAKANITHNPPYAEFVFFCMATATQEQINSLNHNERKHFLNDKTMRRFAENESENRRDFMLTRLGITSIRIYGPVDNIPAVDEALKRSKEMFKEKNRPEVMKEMAEGKVFAIGSKDVMFSCQLAEMNSQSQVFRFNYQYSRMQQKLMDARLVTHNMSFIDGAKALDELTKISLSILCNEDMAESVCGVSEYYLKVLMVLFPNRETFMTATAIAVKMNENIRQEIKKTGVTRAANAMAGTGLILKKAEFSGSKKTMSYTIQDKGIEVVGKYIRFILNEAKAH